MGLGSGILRKCRTPRDVRALDDIANTVGLRRD